MAINKVGTLSDVGLREKLLKGRAPCFFGRDWHWLFNGTLSCWDYI